MNLRSTRSTAATFVATVLCAGLAGVTADDPPVPPQPGEFDSWDNWMAVQEGEDKSVVSDGVESRTELEPVLDSDETESALDEENTLVSDETESVSARVAESTVVLDPNVVTADKSESGVAVPLISAEDEDTPKQTILQRISHQTFGRFGYLQNRTQPTAASTPPNSNVRQAAIRQSVVARPQPVAALQPEQSADASQFVTIRVPRDSVQQAPQTQPAPRMFVRPAQTPQRTHQAPQVATIGRQQFAQAQPAAQQMFVQPAQVQQQIPQNHQVATVGRQQFAEAQPAAQQMFVQPAQVQQQTPRTTQVTTVSSQQRQQPVLTQTAGVVGSASFSSYDSQNGDCAPDNCCSSVDGCNECGGTGCTSCNNCYQCCEPRHLFEVGVEAAFLQASLDGASSSVTAFDALNNPVASVSSNSTDDAELAGAPRFWLGVGRGCWGVRGRYFDLQAGDHDFGNPGTLPNALGFAHQLRAYTADVELTRKFCVDSCSGLFSIGARRALLNSSTNANLVSAIAGDIVTGTANTFREFDGAGVTVGFQGNKPIGNPCHGLSLFCGARASFLWGDARAASGTTTSAINFLGATSDRQFAVAGTDEAEMTITELQLGVQHTRKLECMPVVAFFRVAAEWQHWSDQSELLTAANSTSAIVPGASVIANGNTGAQDLDLVGLVLSTGITY